MFSEDIIIEPLFESDEKSEESDSESEFEPKSKNWQQHRKEEEVPTKNRFFIIWVR